MNVDLKNLQLNKIVLMKSLVNNLSVQAQTIFGENKKRLKGKPYEKYLNTDLYVYDEAIRNAQAGPLANEYMQPPTQAGFNKVLEVGHSKGHTGYGILENGTLYSASLTKFPNCTPKMFEWWMWWHAVEPERYLLWHPYSHVSADYTNREVLTSPGLSHRERYMGNTSLITEYLNEVKSDVAIDFINPLEMGLDDARLEEANIKTSFSGYVYFAKPRVKIGTMLHLVKVIEGGCELISRYYLGDQMGVKVAGKEIEFPHFIKNAMLTKSGSLQAAYAQVMHDQIEYTNLASILPDLFNEFGKQ